MKNAHIWNFGPFNLPIHYTTFMGLRRRYIVRVVIPEHPNVKRFLVESCPVITGSKSSGFGGKWGLNIFSNPEKAHPFVEARLLTYCVKIRAGTLAVGDDIGQTRSSAVTLCH